MKSNLNVVAMPEPGNEGDDLNWVQWVVIGHEDPEMLQHKALDELSKSFWTEERRKAWFDGWGGDDPTYSAQAFLDHADEQGYTVFPPLKGMSWITPPTPLPFITT